MLLSVVTITKRYGGFDVAADSLSRQTVWRDLVAKGDVEYLLVDELANDPARKMAGLRLAQELGLGEDDFTHVKPEPYDPPRYCQIARANNTALRLARGRYLFLMNDFCWLEDDTLERFLEEMAKGQDKALVGCIAHHAAVPPLDHVTMRGDPYSIFGKPFKGQDWGFPDVPTTWTDPRTASPPESNDPFLFEGSVALIPTAVARKVGWDEDYDYAIANDQTQFAFDALTRGLVQRIVTLQDVTAYQLAHDVYAPNPPDRDDHGRLNQVRFARRVVEYQLHLHQPPANIPSIVFALPGGATWQILDGHDPFKNALGGRETACVRLAQELAKLGWHVSVLSNFVAPRFIDSVVWTNATDATLKLARDYDVLVTVDDPTLLRRFRARKLNVYHAQFAAPPSPIDAFTDSRIDAYLLLSHYQRETLREHSPAIDALKVVVLGNGVDLERYDSLGDVPIIPRRLVWSSSPDRGLHHLLRWWPFLKQQYPDISLRIFYNLGALEQYRFQHEARAEWLRAIDHGRTLPGVEYVGPVPQAVLAREQKQAELFVYTCDPSQPTETYCVTALECCAARVPMLLSAADCLTEVFGEVAWMIQSPVVDELWIRGIGMLLDDPAKLRENVEKARAFAEQHTWAKVAARWDAFLRQRMAIGNDRDAAVTLAEDATYNLQPIPQATTV